jgi:hypothetical protein
MPDWCADYGQQMLAVIRLSHAVAPDVIAQAAPIHDGRARRSDQSARMASVWALYEQDRRRLIIPSRHM